MKAWRFIGKQTLYVSEISRNSRGDTYAYIDNESKALALTQDECRAFCGYMRQCATVGFYA